MTECHLEGFIDQYCYSECHPTVFNKCSNCGETTCFYHTVYIPIDYNWLCKHCLASYHSTKTFTDGTLWSKSGGYTKVCLEHIEDIYLTTTKACKQ